MTGPSKLSASIERVRRKGIYGRTYGCQMNEYDTERVFSMLADEYQPVDSIEDADVVFINTCSVRGKSEHKLYSYLGSLGKLKKENPRLVIGVAGCVAQQEGAALLSRCRNVDFVVGTHNLSLIPSLIERAVSGGGREAVVDYRDEWETLPGVESISELQPSSAFGQFYSPVRALVAVQRGCDKRCAFCVVPTTRGREVSRDPAEIEREVRAKVLQGAKEVMLLGQTVNSYGRSRDSKCRFEQLIERLAELEGLERIRFTSPHPSEVTPSFIGLFNRVDKLMPHIHLPLQSGSDRILKLMHRDYTSSRYLEIVDELRQAVPGIAITSDFIVGFPTETEEDFQQTLGVMEEVGFSGSYSFCYSVRPNTYAQRKFGQDEEVALDEAKSRLERLQKLQDELSLNYNRRFLGEKVEVLVEGAHKQISSKLRGRIPQNVLVDIGFSGVEVGSFQDVVIEHASPHGLRATAP